jgi:hypothetical protein
MTQPIYDFTGRGERGVGGGPLGPIDPYNNEWVRQSQEVNRQAFYELLGMILPVHEKFGAGLDKLGQAILDSASGRGTTVAKAQGEDYRPGVADRLAGLTGTWTGNAMQDLGAAFQMNPEDLVKLRQSVLAMQDNPELQGELLTGLTAGLRERYGDSEGLLAAAEDFGSPGLGIAASGKAAGLTRKLISKDPVEPVTPVHKGMVNTPHHPPAAGLMGMIREDAPQGPLATPSDTQVILGQAAELGTGPSTRQGMPTPEWDPEDPEFQAWLKEDKLEGAEPPVSREGVHYVEGENVDPAMVPKRKSEFDILNTDKSLEEIEDAIQAGDVFSDSEIDTAIQDINKKLNLDLSSYVHPDEKDWLEDALNLFVSERHKRKRRKDKGEGGSAGAKKQMSQLDQMKAEGAGEPDAGWPVAHGIEGFTGDADFGAEVTDLLSKAQFSPKRNLWIFPDVGAGAEGTFDINGFINRMGNPRHPVNTEELSILGDILTLASQYPSKRNLSSMAEDLYKMVSGTIKERLRADQGKLFDPGTLGFNL